MAKIDRAIEFVESNRCMMESLKSQDDDQDVVSYIINVLKHYKKKPQELQLPGNQSNS